MAQSTGPGRLEHGIGRAVAGFGRAKKTGFMGGLSGCMNIYMFVN